MKIFRKKKSILLLIFLLILLVSSQLRGCFFYDYGVDKYTTKLPYLTYYEYERSKRYDFTTVLFTTQKDLVGSYGYHEFTVSINHMYLETLNTKDKGHYISEIVFSDYSEEQDILVNIESIQLVHKDKEGNIIPFERIDQDIRHDLTKKPIIWWQGYKKIYDPEKLPKELDEYIYLEVVVNGVTKKIEYNLPIRKKLHYTWFDVMMGV